MTPPRLVARAFQGPSTGDTYARLARVLAFTAAQHCQHWTIDVQTITPPPVRSALGVQSHEANTQKLDAWLAAVAAAEDGDRLLLMDADAAICGDLDAVWATPFDVAYTVRPPGCRLPLNAGVIFVRVNDRSRAWLAEWRALNARMLSDIEFHRPWRKRYGGINQAALGAMLEGRPDEHPFPFSIHLAALPCAIWNCEDTGWRDFDPDVTRILHVKSQLRMAIFQGLDGADHLRRLVAWWRAQERAAVAALARPA